MNSRKFNKGKIGFTLAELLIALAILGLIAIFTIPKLLNAQSNARNRAIFKEDFSAISQASAILMSRGLNTAGSDDYLVFQPLINYTKTVHTGANINEVNFWLANGSTLASFNFDIPGGGDSIIIDVNDLNGPNALGEDQFTVFTCWKNTGCAAGFATGYGPTDHFIRGGEVSYINQSNDPGSYAIYNSLFQ